MTRRRFCSTTSVALGMLASGQPAVRAVEQTTQGQGAETRKPIPDRGPRIAEERVKEFVIAGHGNPARVEEMLKAEPKLVNAVWDWGGGDYESALGGAAHMGRADIARILLAHGARFDLFAAAMLGELEIVRAILTASPELTKVPGPHGIPLIAHAGAGGEKAVAVLHFIETLKH